MTAVSIAAGVTPTVILAAPTTPWLFCHIQNLGTGAIYIQFDNDSATLATTNGWKIESGGSFSLENTGGIQAYKYAIKGVHAEIAAQEVRVQTA